VEVVKIDFDDGEFLVDLQREHPCAVSLNMTGADGEAWAFLSAETCRALAAALLEKAGIAERCAAAIDTILEGETS
jgi:hypothetical protein